MGNRMKPTSSFIIRPVYQLLPYYSWNIIYIDYIFFLVDLKGDETHILLH